MVCVMRVHIIIPATYHLFRKCAPRLSTDAAEKLASHFVEIRAAVRKMESDMHSRSSVPITIRYAQRVDVLFCILKLKLNFPPFTHLCSQLEAIIRISESLAKMSLSPVATEQHVDEAIRLFRVSTLVATQAGYGAGGVDADTRKNIIAAQHDLLKRLPIGSKMLTTAAEEHLRVKGYSNAVINLALTPLVQRETIQFQYQRKFIVRIGV